MSKVVNPSNEVLGLLEYITQLEAEIGDLGEVGEIAAKFKEAIFKRGYTVASGNHLDINEMNRAWLTHAAQNGEEV
jgi:hypothetical protein